LAKRSVSVRILGQEYRIRSEADEDWLQRVAGHVDAAMSQVRERTGTVDTLDVAVLTSLNLAREVLALRARLEDEPSGESQLGDDRLRALIELAEKAVGQGENSGLASARSNGDDPALLTLPAGEELDEVREGLLGPMMDSLEVTGAPDKAAPGARKART